MDHEILFSATAIALDQTKRTIYLSTPLTTGINTREANESNARYYIQKIRELRPEYNVINPAELITIEGWSHSDYIHFWKCFMDRFVDIVVMAPRWDESAGCGMERAHAERSDLEIFDYSEIVK